MKLGEWKNSFLVLLFAHLRISEGKLNNQQSEAADFEFVPIRDQNVAEMSLESQQTIDPRILTNKPCLQNSLSLDFYSQL